MSDNEGCLPFILLVVGASVLWANWDTTWVLSARFKVDAENIYVERKPHDCDFLSAPIGQKHCSYESVYQVTDDHDRRNRRLYVSYFKQPD